jgi:hypothetical protein
LLFRARCAGAESPGFVVLRVSHLIANANQAAWLSGEMLKESHPNA